MIAESKSKGALSKATRAKATRSDIVRSRQLMGETVEPLGSRTTVARPSVARPSQAVANSDAPIDEVAQLLQEEHVIPIAIDQLERHPLNRVIDPNSDDIRELAASIVAHSQREPMRVRRLASGRYQILSGERRYTALRLAGIGFARCIVVVADDAAALAEVALGNAARQDLNPIQRAELMEHLVKQGGKTLLEAGKLFGLNSESGCKNALRMLKLPKKIRDLVISGQLPERVARRLIPYLASDEIGKAIADDLTHQHFGEENMLRLWQDDLAWIEETLRDLVRPLSDDITHYYPYPKGEHAALFDWQSDAKLTEQLNVVELPWSTEFDPKTRRDRIEPRKFATNVKLWHKLNDPLVDAAIETGKKKSSKSSSPVGRPSQAVAPKKQTPAQLAAEAKRKAKEADDRLNNFTREWLERLLRCSLADRSSDDCLVALTLPWIVGQCPSHDLRQAHERALHECQVKIPKPKAKHRFMATDTLDALPIIAKANNDMGTREYDVAAAFWRILLWPVTRLVGDSAAGSELTPAGQLPDKITCMGYDRQAIAQLAALAKVSAETAWKEGATDDTDQRRLISVWLLRHTKDQLHALRNELHVTEGSSTMGRDELADCILRFHRPGKPLPVPKRLAALAKH